MANLDLIFLAGSARRESLNKQLARYACECAAAYADVDAEFLDLGDYPMPIYNGDLEAESGLPEEAERFKARLVACDGLFIASPEYNSSFTPLLKNAIDWASRRATPDEPALLAYRGKVAGLAATSAGALGGLRGLVALRMLLGNIGVHVLPDQAAVPNGHQVFADTPNAEALDRVRAVVDALVDTTRALNRR